MAKKEKHNPPLLKEGEAARKMPRNQEMVSSSIIFIPLPPLHVIRQQHTVSVVDLEHRQKRHAVNGEMPGEMIVATLVESDILNEPKLKPHVEQDTRDEKPHEISDKHTTMAEPGYLHLPAFNIRWTSNGNDEYIFEGSADGEYILSKEKSRQSEPLVFEDVGSPPVIDHQDSWMGQPSDGPVSSRQDSLMDQPSSGRLSSPLGSPPNPPVIGPQDSSMGQPSVGPVLISSHVIGPQFTVEDSVTLIFKKAAAGGYFVSTAAESRGPWRFKISPCDTALHRKLELLLLGETWKRVAILKAKIKTTHGRWNAYTCNGRSIEDREKAFTVSRGAGADLHVALATRSSGAIDFKVKGNLQDTTCTIYKGDSSAIIAQMCPVENEEADRFMVKVSPNVDCAFVVSLVGVVDIINSPGKMKDLARLALQGLGIAAAVGGPVLGATV